MREHHANGDVAGCLQVHDQIYAADINSQFKGCRGNDGRDITCFQAGFNAIPGFTRNAAVVSKCQFRCRVARDLAV